ncbi:ABC transporter substrate-binding protein [Pseudorhodoferax sp. Leaf265]|uniref:ABC transporter substrate-binding protein n=1 Tax=Pseudorhodoferax sp. Leaf265 TaxID=1736315 RepID=UPI00070062E0|nr:ABC transporter substrate-binding protein [Pseudorhodoferax sp. Leaf265]KQP08406.1 ABC transporter substrate-binding protein [Pseudorhodoferax sp. Leaf265]
MNKRVKKMAAAMAMAGIGAMATAQTVPIVGIVELSGPGATAGVNFDNGVKLAVKEINAAGGILGKKIQYTALDSQTQPGVAKGLAAKAVDQDVPLVIGPVFSGSILVSMNETRRAEVPNIIGGEAAAITQQGNPYVFRASFTQAAAMPKVARYLSESLKVKTLAVIYVNNDFGKGGRDMIGKAVDAKGIKVAADISTDQGQVDFSSAVLKAKQSNADALFVYSNEEESARLLKELRKQGYDKPIVGETTLANDKVIELAGEAANGVIAHVGLTADAPNPTVQAFAQRYQAEYKIKADHNAMKGYIGMHVARAGFEKVGRIDPKAFAKTMHGISISADKYPGVLFDVTYDDKGDLDRESFFVRVANGKTQVIETLKPAR